MSDDADKSEQIAHSTIAQGQPDRVRSYLERGRQGEELSDDELSHLWRVTARAWADQLIEQQEAEIAQKAGRPPRVIQSLTRAAKPDPRPLRD